MTADTTTAAPALAEQLLDMDERVNDRLEAILVELQRIAAALEARRIA